MLEPIDRLGAQWLSDAIGDVVDHIEHLTPAEFVQTHRYLPDSVTSQPGPMSLEVCPFMIEPLEAADPYSPVREVNFKKGVQVMYTTAILESILFYYIAHVKTRPCMLVTADRELAKMRIENYILPMLQQSDMSHLIVSSDEGNTRKTGKTSNHLQWQGGGFLLPGGANNPNKMRSASILLMLKDELDGWLELVGKDGDPDKLTDDRCSAFWEVRKIFRGSTPLLKGSSKIQFQYERGDQRQYNVRCRSCGFSQVLRWNRENKETGEISGFVWEFDSDGTLILESVRYLCQNCQHEHFEYDKTYLFDPNNGAEWVPTAKPVEPNIRSYHLPAMYSPVGFQPWYKCVQTYLDGFDPVAKRVTNIGKYQIFYNNILGEPFELLGAKLRFETVSAHRRDAYRQGEIPNEYARKHSGGPILFLTCTIDVHKSNLAVAVIGWTAGKRAYLIEYHRFETEGDCAELSEKPWQDVRELIEERVYTADDGSQYRINLTLVDASYNTSTVVDFCSDYSGGVYPILGRDRPAKAASIMEFSPFTTKAGTLGYKITVDYYKDNMSTYLRREWQPGDVFGVQKEGHFNAPVDTPDKALKELTVESRRKKTDANGAVSYYWHRPSSVDNELWDLLGYGFAAVDMIAASICLDHFKQESVDWFEFWGFCANPENNALFAREHFVRVE